MKTLVTTAAARRETPDESLFATAHLRANLRQRSIRGGLITLSAQALKFVLNLGSVAILARLLTPEDYGLVAMVSPILGFVGLFKDLGLSLATVQKEEINHDQVTTLFWINFGAASILMGACILISPLVAMLYADKRTAWITMASAGTFLFGGLTAQHQALLTRQMRFGTLAAIDLLALSGSIGVGILTACLGWRYWSLVAMTASTGLINCVSVWIASPWRPGKPKRGVNVREMLRFGGAQTGFQICGYVSANFDRLLIGKSLGAAPLGLYSRAFQLLVLPMQMILSPISNILLPMLSRLTAEREKYSAMVRDIGELMLMGTAPLAAISIVAADPIVATFLGPRWKGAVDIFRALSLVAIAMPMNNLCIIILQSSGKTGVLLRWGLISMTVSVASILIGMHWGIRGIAFSWAVGALFVRTPWFYLIVSRNTSLSFRDLMGPILLHTVPFAIVVTGGIFLQGLVGMLNPVLALIFDVSLVLVAYGGFLVARGKHRLAISLFRQQRTR